MRIHKSVFFVSVNYDHAFNIAPDFSELFDHVRDKGYGKETGSKMGMVDIKCRVFTLRRAMSTSQIEEYLNSRNLRPATFREALAFTREYFNKIPPMKGFLLLGSHCFDLSGDHCVLRIFFDIVDYYLNQDHLLDGTGVDFVWDGSDILWNLGEQFLAVEK